MTSIAALVLACGGGGQSAKDDEPVGDTHATGTGEGDVPLTGDTGDTGTLGADAGADEPIQPPAAVVFRLINSGADELSFNMNKGWQPVIFAWSGQRGQDAKPIVMFPRHCTASCDAPEEEVCPYCPPPETNKEARENQKYEHVAAGGQLDVPWDGQVYVYEKTRGTQQGKKTRCECWRKDDPPPQEYTVSACGLRLTDRPGVRTKSQCIEAKMTLPPPETPMVVEFDFPDPPKKKKRRR